MGGIGSGDWYRYGRKATVEQSLILPVSSFRRRLFVGTTGVLTWSWKTGEKSSVRYCVTGDNEQWIVTFTYRWRATDDVRLPVRLQPTPTQFGGRRWWFTCPLLAGERACKRRVGKLYLPPGQKFFGCRQCHDLTYQSCQEAHQTERLFGGLGADAHIARLLASLERIK